METGTRLHGKNNKTVIGKLGFRENIWEFHAGNNGDETTAHPAPFPMKLAKDHLRSWTNPGDTILDPFMGSGTTGVACAQLGRNFIGIELDPDYFAIAEKRIKTAQSQEIMF